MTTGVGVPPSVTVERLRCGDIRELGPGRASERALVNAKQDGAVEPNGHIGRRRR
jgi:hypothetical protein